MTTKTDRVLARLKGQEEQERRREQLRKTEWYRRWNNFAKAVEDAHVLGKRQLMYRAFRLVEECKGHNYQHVADASREANELVCDERGWK